MKVLLTLTICFALFATHGLSSSVSTEPVSLTVSEVIAKHLDSIGPETARTSVKTRIIAGTAQVVFRTVPVGQAFGRVVLASESSRHLIGMKFDSPVYPKEGFSFNGTGFIAAFVTPGIRSPLGSFLVQNDRVFKDGLMGGSLNQAWLLLNLHNKESDLEYAGLKKVDKRMLHELKYSPRGSGQLEISFYFDETTFQHVRTEYKRVIPAATSDRSYTNVQERETRLKLTEDFSSFKAEGPLNLPHLYTITFSSDAQSGTFQGEWTLKLGAFSFNEKIDPETYKLTGY